MTWENKTCCETIQLQTEVVDDFTSDKKKNMYTKYWMVLNSNINSIYISSVVKYSFLCFCVFFETRLILKQKEIHVMEYLR